MIIPSSMVYRRDIQPLAVRKDIKRGLYEVATHLLCMHMNTYSPTREQPTRDESTALTTDMQQLSRGARGHIYMNYTVLAPRLRETVKTCPHHTARAQHSTATCNDTPNAPHT